jgi:hypothetical protein
VRNPNNNGVLKQIRGLRVCDDGPNGGCGIITVAIDCRAMQSPERANQRRIWCYAGDIPIGNDALDLPAGNHSGHIEIYDVLDEFLTGKRNVQDSIDFQMQIL